MTPAELRSRNFWSVSEVAARVFEIDERTVRRGIEEGQIPAVKVGNKILIPGPRLADMIDPPQPSSAPQPLELLTADPTPPIEAALEILLGAVRALETLLPRPAGITGSITGRRNLGVQSIRPGQSTNGAASEGDSTSPLGDSDAA